MSVAIDGVAGLQNIELDDPKMRNVDLTDVIGSKSDATSVSL